MKALTPHERLVKSAVTWARRHGGCGVVFHELKAISETAEIPDVIGFGYSDHSVMIECKCTRADFHADKKKPFRQDPERGVGRLRYYCCPAGVIFPEDLPIGWGLLWVNARGKAELKHRQMVHLLNKDNNPRNGLIKFPVNLKAERAILYSALRRLEVRGVLRSALREQRESLAVGDGLNEPAEVF